MVPVCWSVGIKIPFFEYNVLRHTGFSPAATDPWYMRWFAFKNFRTG